MSVLQDIYKRHLDATCGIGYDPRTVKVPLNGRIYTFRFDKPDSPIPLKPAEMVEGTRTVEVYATMSLPEAWKVLSKLNGIRYHSTTFGLMETQDSKGFGRIERVLKKKLTSKGNLSYSFCKGDIDLLVDALDKAASVPPMQEPHRKIVESIWMAQNGPMVRSTGPHPVDDYVFEAEVKHNERGIIEFIGDLEKAIIASK
ncbi:MAG: hypothetical protein NTW67_06445 [Candidatus Woesearchaeota archaeon]|nr:hypothetical protein [Candidatus Woesearchaeota archaeon]